MVEALVEAAAAVAAQVEDEAAAVVAGLEPEADLEASAAVVAVDES